MNILIITPSNPKKIAGIVACDLSHALSSIDKNVVKILVRDWYGNSEGNIVSYNNQYMQIKYRINRKIFNISGKVDRKLKSILKNVHIIKKETIRINREYSIVDYNLEVDRVKSKRILKRVGFIPDVIIVLFIGRFITYKNMYELHNITKAPIVLYMMDMAILTGGCHYSWNCFGYTEKCGNCPALYPRCEIDQTRKNWLYKKKYIDLTKIVPVAASEYSFDQLKASSLFKNKSKSKVMLSIDSEKYIPANKINARAELGLPPYKRILLFAAAYVNSRRKGFRELLEAIECLKERNLVSDIYIAIAGRIKEDIQFDIPYEYSLLGYMNHDRLPLAFQSADVFLCPSIEDSGPMMINQAMMSGTPVVSFEMGVAYDLVITGRTGYQAKLKDSKDFAIGIENILSRDEKEYNDMAKNCRQLALELCHSSVQAAQFMQIIEESI